MSEPLLVKGSAELQRKLKRLAADMPRQAQQGANAAAWYLVSQMQQNKLRGQALHVRTGKLISSWSVRPAGGNIVGAVGATNVVYAPVHEFGLDKIENVRAHLRREVNPDRLQHPRRRRGERGGDYVPPKRPRGRRAGALPMSARQVNRLVNLAGSRADATGVRHYVVRAHRRHMVLPARRYMRDTIAEKGDAACRVAAAVMLRAGGGR